MKTILSWAMMFRTIRSGKNHNVGCSNKDLFYRTVYWRNLSQITEFPFLFLCPDLTLCDEYIENLKKTVSIKT